MSTILVTIRTGKVLRSFQLFSMEIEDGFSGTGRCRETRRKHTPYISMYFSSLREYDTSDNKEEAFYDLQYGSTKPKRRK